MNVINNKVVYVWYNVDTDYIFYVGEGTEKRANETKIGRRNKLFVDYIKNNNCCVKIVKRNLTDEQAKEIETNLVEYYKSIGQACCNITKNGKPGAAFGSDNPNYKNGSALKETYKLHPELKEKTKHLRSDNGRAKRIAIIFNGEIIKEFDCIADCSEYLISIGITYPPIQTASQRIAYAIKKNLTIGCYNFKFL